MTKFINKEDITFILSLIGSLYAVLNISLKCLKSKFSCDIEIIKYKQDTDYFLAYVMIKNKSSKPLSVNKFSLEVNGSIIDCDILPIDVLISTTKENNIITNQRVHHSTSFPLLIAPDFGYSGYLHFQFLEEENPGTGGFVNLIMTTIHGKKKKFQLRLHDVPNLF